MIEKIKEYKFIIIAILLMSTTPIYNVDAFFEALNIAKGFFIEMVEIMPAIMIISALINQWVPREVIIKHFGDGSGIKGAFFSFFIGSFSAGPIYAAFPVTHSLLKKGASVANTVIIISSWAVIKIVMFMVESSFLGINFALTRYLLTVPAILLMSYTVSKLVRREEIIDEENEEKSDPILEILEKLPGMNCGACGAKNCEGFASEVHKGNKILTDCIYINES
jgi:uncharacterized membrane protein YraQ (UPF0718 family)